MSRPAHRCLWLSYRHEQAPDMSATFKAVLFTVVGFTLFASIAAIWLAYFNHNLGTLTAIQQAAQQSVFDPMNTIVKLGLGVILGLIGGRTNSNHEAARTV
jgi:p-aminobenzoyl-glutamate transporter AbgT